MSLRDAYKQRLSARVEEQRARLGALKARAKRAAADGRIIGYEELADAERSLGQFASRLKKVAGAGYHALAEVRGGVGKALDNLGASTRRAAERLSEATASEQPASATSARRVAAQRPKAQRATRRSARAGGAKAAIAVRAGRKAGARTASVHATVRSRRLHGVGRKAAAS